MMDTTTSIGDLGEAVAADYLRSRGYEITATKFRRPHGEIDIVARKDELVFVEVKAMQCRIPEDLPRDGDNDYRPEENVGRQKRQRLRRIIDTYLQTRRAKGSWRCDLICVYLDRERSAARVKRLKNVII
jgi:putative endonuclease